MLLEYLSFFSFGNTNSIATIDLINAYNGISASYDIKIVGFLMMTSTFAPSIFFSLKQSSRNYSLTLKYSLILNSLWGFLFLLSCFIGRYHLFVWSVFTKPSSICPAGTPLNLKIKVNQEEPVALEDNEYPDWLWTIMEEEKISENMSVEDQLKIRKRNISHDRKKEIRDTIELLKNQ
ncbi:hypothetical protein ACO0SA_003015 [Hanseniaspora valbyensis]